MVWLEITCGGCPDASISFFAFSFRFPAKLDFRWKSGHRRRQVYEYRRVMARCSREDYLSEGWEYKNFFFGSI